MPRALKVFKTHIGFYDLIVSAPSMKAAARAWNVSPRIFAHGQAAPASEPDEVELALAHPGAVLKRLHGTRDPFAAAPAPPRQPALSRQQKKRLAVAKRQRARREAEARRERLKAEKQAKQARQELAELDRQEATLRKKRQALERQAHLGGH